jgi:TrmH family RNA methyltransferase
MLPLHKLRELPAAPRLRKMAKLFGEAEYRISRGGRLSPGEGAYLASLTALVGEAASLSPAAAGVLADAETALADPDGEGALRAINHVRHLLLEKTGRQPADWDLIDHTGQLDPARRRPFPGMRVYLEDIRSPFNVGAMFRTAEAFGAERLLLSPLCADPRHPRAVRTAMGCVAVMPWERLTGGAAGNTPDSALGEGPFFALETGGTALGKFVFPRRAAMIVGSEELGISPGALALADQSLGRLSIPCYGVKGSLNVSVAFGIAMQGWAMALVEQAP